MSDAEALAGLLAEDDRLRAFACVVLGSTTVDDVVEATGIERRRVVQALERLPPGGRAAPPPGRRGAPAPGGPVPPPASGRGSRAQAAGSKRAPRQPAPRRPAFDPKDIGATPEQAE